MALTRFNVVLGIAAVGIGYVLIFGIGLRHLDFLLWPYTGETSATQAMTSPTRAGTVGRDCFTSSHEVNILRAGDQSGYVQLFETCSDHTRLVGQSSSSEALKVIARCEALGLIVERSVIVFRGTSADPQDICMVAIFEPAIDPGIGEATFSSYE